MSSSADPFLSWNRVILLRVLRVLGAGLSILGSLAIIAHVVKGKRYRKSPMHRLVMALSIVDVGYSFHLAMAASFLYPIYAPSTFCTVDGCIMMLAVASPLYNAALSYYYCLTVVGGVSNERFARRYESFFHVGIFVIALAVAIPGLVLGLYNPKGSGLGCWVLPYPPGCQEEEPPAPCERGGTATTGIVQLVGSIVPFSLSVLSLIINNLILYGNMRRLEVRNRRYTSHFHRASAATAAAAMDNSTNDNDGKNVGLWRRVSLLVLRSSASSTSGLFRASATTTATAVTTTHASPPPPPPGAPPALAKPVSHRMAVQSFCYVGAFWMSYGWGLASFIFMSVSDGRQNPFVLEAINFFFYPAQGFMNALVYLRPNYLRWRDAGYSRMAAVKHALFSLKAPRRRRPGQHPPPPQQRSTLAQQRIPMLPLDMTDCSNTEDGELQKRVELKPNEDDDDDDDNSDSSSSYGWNDKNGPIVNATEGGPPLQCIEGNPPSQ